MGGWVRGTGEEGLQLAAVCIHRASPLPAQAKESVTPAGTALSDCRQELLLLDHTGG